MNRKIVTSGDGSQTIFQEEGQVHFHSTHGAWQETQHVFIQHGLNILRGKKEINIFEMGFGTGLNALASLAYAAEHQIKIHYTSIDLHPLAPELLDSLNYQQLVSEKVFNQYKTMLETAWGTSRTITENFEFSRYQEDLLQFRTEASFDLIYFDAFAPETQPELWSEPTMRQMFTMLQAGGILVTYCAKGSFKRALKAAGFEIVSPPGPPGKREMTRAKKPS